MNTQRVGNRNPQQFHVGYPITYVVNVQRVTRHHVCFQSVLRGGFECSRQFEQLTQRHIGFYGINDFTDDLRNARNNFGRSNFIHTSRHECLLTFDAPDVALRITRAYISHGSLAVHVLLTRIKINDKSSVIVPRILVEHALLNVNVHAADRVDNFYKAGGVDLNVMIDVNAEKIFNCRFGERDSAVSKRRVNLVVASPANFDASITRNGKERRLIEVRINRRNHQRIGTTHIIFALVHAHD